MHVHTTFNLKSSEILIDLCQYLNTSVRAVGSSEKQGGHTLALKNRGGETLKLILKIAFLRVKLMKSTKNRGAVAPPAP